MSWVDCWPSQSAHIVAQAVDDASRGRKTRFNAARTMSNGELRWFDVLVSPLTIDPDGPPLILAVSRDVTERHELEEELRRAKEDAEFAANARGDFVATMSHELRTPLAGIISHLDLIDASALPTREGRRVRQIQEAAESLLRIVNDVLDIARIEADGLPLVEQSFDIATLIDDIVSLMGPLARKKGLRLTHRVDRGCPDRLRGDAGRLRQVLLNLTSNAVKFTAEGGVGLNVCVRAMHEGRATLEIAVADSGIGISSDTRDAMYKRFSQLDPSIRGRYGGTGLGLAISRHIIERMGGRIGVESEPGKGTTFTIELDLAVAEPSTGCDDGRSTTHQAEFDTFDLTVLVVDDNALHREVTAELLTAKGCEVETAADGASAIDMVARRAFDLVFLDEQMPGLSGSQTARRIRALRGSEARLRLVACTANVFGSLRDDAPFDECLIKPLTRAKVSPVLGRAAAADWAPRSARSLYDLLPRDRAVALIAEFHEELRALDAGIDTVPAVESAARAHKLVSSAAVLGLDTLGLALRAAEAALLQASAEETNAVGRLRHEIRATLAVADAGSTKKTEHA